MNIISTVNDKRFSINNIQYLKNYVTEVHGSKIEIFNCYERHDVLAQLSHYSNFMVNGVVYPNAVDLQAALLPILYSRSNLGGDTPDIDQDNIEVVRYIRSTSASPASILAQINSLEMYTLDTKQSLWFIISVPGSIGINNRAAQPRTLKYKMVNYGKGTYGQGAFQLSLTDIELVYAADATTQDIAAQPGTQLINFGTITQTISQWVNSQSVAFAFPAHANAYTLLRGIINGVETAYIWTRGAGNYGIGGSLTTQNDFLMLPETVITSNQDNIDIKKTFTISRNYTTSSVLTQINNLLPYTVSDEQSVWFVGRQLTIILAEDDIDSPRSTGVINPMTIKYKMINKGKGIYGSGQTQLTAADIELVYSDETPLTELEVAVETDIVPFTLTAGQTISQWLNMQNPALLIQPQEEGYTIFKTTAADSKSYLWISTTGTYGSGRSQSVPDNFQLLNEAITPVIQDNIDIKKTFTIPNAYTTATILAAINGLTPYVVNETQSIWFIGRQRTLLQRPQIEPGEPVPLETISNPLILKYKMLNKGKGTYGLGQTQLTSADIELVYTNEASLEDLESGAETQIIPFTLTAEQTLSQWINVQNTALVIQPQESGYTIFKGTVDSSEVSYLWIGAAGTYGSGRLQSIDADFQLLNDVAPAPFMPGYDQTLLQNAETSRYAIHNDTESSASTAYGITLQHTGADGHETTIRFADPVVNVTYNIPAKEANDVFAMVSDVHRPVKTITLTTTGFADGTYTLQAEDRGRWLLFKIPMDFNIKIPDAVFPVNTLIEGETADIGQATFISDSVMIAHGASENPKTAEINSVFGLKFRSDTEVSLFGKLELY